MTTQALSDIVEPKIANYIAALSTETDPFVIQLACQGHARGFPFLGLQAASCLELLASLLRARRVFEFGSGFGYSAYFLARAVGEGGQVHGSEPEAELLGVHRTLFERHPYRQRIHLHQGLGEHVLESLSGEFDLIFIDHEKTLYPSALAAAIPRVRVGGAILADNVLWSGRTADTTNATDRDTEALRQFNTLSHEDPRLKTTILPVGDGLSLSLRLS